MNHGQLLTDLNQSRNFPNRPKVWLLTPRTRRLKEAHPLRSIIPWFTRLPPTPYVELSGIRENPMVMKALLIFKKTRSRKRLEKSLSKPDLGFYWVQLCNFRKPNVMEVKDPKKEESRPEGGDGWAKLREAQTQALDLKHTGMAVIIDLADAHNPNDIHPKNKQDVGGRLAQWALHQTYDKKHMVASGPLYSGHEIKGNKIHVSFKNVGQGLMVGKKVGLDPTQAVKGNLKHFSIAGADKKWHWAEAKIVGDQVVLSSKNVKTPVAARYAFTMNPADANLYNIDGLPAGPFRTDNW